MQLSVLVLSFLSFGVLAKEIELLNFHPSPKTDKEFLDYGTLRLAKVKRNEFVVTGTFIVKRNSGHEVTVGKEDYLNDIFGVSLPLPKSII